MKIVTAAEKREIDRTTSQKFGVPSLKLMENAGTAVAQFVISQYPAAKCIGVICGKGNNGGDGLVAARKLREAGKEVRLVLLADPADLRGDAVEMFNRLPLAPLIAKSSTDLNGEKSRAVFGCDVLLDAILGTGFKPPVSPLYAEAIAMMNTSASIVVGVDVPSGTDSDAMGRPAGAVARADAVVMFTAPCPAHIFGELTSGPVVIAPIGSPDAAIVSSLQLNLITAREVAPLIGPRPADSNKGIFGHVLVVGGSLGKAGAAAMAGMSALRSGAGLATVATAKSVLATVAGFHPELMTEPLAETKEGSIALGALARAEKLAESKTVFAIGPGISRNADTVEFVQHLVEKSKAPVVLDADGLNAFEGHVSRLSGRSRPLVLTPHPGEMARLLSTTVAQVQADRLNAARNFARDHDAVVVLKGHRTLVADPDGTVWVNTTGNPGMATGGTGDILTGMIAGFIAQHPRHVMEAVVAAVYLHGLAGDVARDLTGEHCMVATDLVKAFPEAFRRVGEFTKKTSVEIQG